MAKATNTTGLFDSEKAYKQACDDLIDATDVSDIINALARGLWIKNRQTEPPEKKIPSEKDLCDFLKGNEKAQHMAESEGKKILNFWLDQPQPPPPSPKNKKLARTDSDGTQHIEPKVHYIWKLGHACAIVFLSCLRHPDTYRDAFVFGRHAWFMAQKLGYKGDHLLAPIIIAWQNRPPEVDSTRKYDEKRPAAIMRYPRGNIAELFSESEPTGELKRFADDSVIPKSVQVLPSIQRQSVIRDPNKVLLAHVGGVPTQSRRGAVSPELRIFVEAIMQVPPKDRIVTVKITVDQLIKRLYHNGFNWTNQSPKLLAAIHNIDRLTVPFVNSSGKMQHGWAPVKLNTMDFRRRNDDVVFTVTLPEDVKGGPMVEKKFVRMLGLRSAPKWHAYLAMCDLFHRYGVYKGKDGKFYIADPTKPVDRRNDDGHLVNTEGEVIYGPSGKPLSNPYSTAALEQLDREPNQQAIEKYPIVPFDDMIMACFPGTAIDMVKNKRDYTKKAKAHFEKLAGEFEAIYIHEKDEDGWRILPTESHIETYRGVSHKNE